jgi:penicillin-binding protein 2
LQLAHANATFAGKGVPYTPHLLMATQDGVDSKHVPVEFKPTGPSLIKKPGDWDVVNEGMVAVINSGTGSKYGIGKGFPYQIAGKSGTAERFSRTSNAYDTRTNSAYLATRHRALFIAYAPAEDPKISVAVLLEAGAWGASDSGPIARHVLDEWVVDHGGVRPTALAPSDAVTAEPIPETDQSTDPGAGSPQPASSVAPAPASSTDDQGDDTP